MLYRILKQTEANRLVFLEKYALKNALEVEETQVVWCGHLEKVYFYWIVIDLPLWYLVKWQRFEFNFRIRFNLIVDQEVFFGYVFCPMVNLVGIKSDLSKLFCVRFGLKWFTFLLQHFTNIQSDENSLFLSR